MMEADRLHAGMAIAMTMRYVCVSIDNCNQVVILTQFLRWWRAGRCHLEKLSKEVDFDRANSNDHTHTHTHNRHP